MFLKKIELRGFKSFAEKTVIEFPAQSDGHVITGIVGPNGSGKSNLTDAIRWVLGEQSIKMLRGKKSQDVIFAGTDTKARLSSAEVLLHLDNSGGVAPVAMAEIVIGRRLYRNGESEYLINGSVSKLHDINLLLAKAHFGHRTYSIIGQGMVDSFVTASAAERQELLEEAAGVKEYQLKKQETINKLATSARNLHDVETVLTEIHPRLRSLTRQVKRLERKEQLTDELITLQISYYGTRWHAWTKELTALNEKLERHTVQYRKTKSESEKLQKIWEEVALAKTVSASFQKLQDEYEQILNKRNKLFQEEFKVKNELINEERPQQRMTPVLGNAFIGELKTYMMQARSIIAHILKNPTPSEILRLKDGLEKIITESDALIKKLGKNEPSNKGENTKLKKQLDDIQKIKARLEKDLEENQKAIDNLKKEEQTKNETIITTQESLQKKQAELNTINALINELKIERARLDAKLEDTAAEIKEERVPFEKIKHYQPKERINEEAIKQDIAKIKHQLELIGGIDDDTLSEYKSTKERFEYLSKEVDDSKQAIKALEKIIEELEDKIQRQFNASFANINKLFQKYFRILFGGGKTLLKKLPPIALKKTEGDELPEEEEIKNDTDMLTELATKKRLGKYAKSKLSAGIEINVTPPGKKLTSITMLSGGEKALTAIALICAIIANRPSPFVILDEVDAALDEANSERFAKILSELSGKTQFIVITHNRETMHQAKILYGVSMGADGVSQMLSVNLEEAEQELAKT